MNVLPVKLEEEDDPQLMKWWSGKVYCEYEEVMKRGERRMMREKTRVESIDAGYK
ncbi:hypothetical protein HanXRQr2_Chr13g0599691 [Helianthus annuus]|uniref:Uncharacterized protein n=1 Tax=Helianthus annuus TaxID=4232 RepID=A0A9K3EK87_HELAN|nr:hypothetical protein HanXRQr2_Chr13g0599691 [Helianthus annuus]KAJ0482298.1 hypothetical protein HanIR_Chr13g0652331 [Helianthus annuus]KAJ0850195.1 hypothetical protein HanPSC8_Chr13g0577771 [Helianthus annuus]